jgi:dolichyl-phosphate-mannose--protein O-mannosyl transferase
MIYRFTVIAVRLPQRVLKTAAALYGLSQVFFLINIQFPVGKNFDEFHYVPSAKQFLALSPNQNWEHPPLGKLLMAVGIALWGDRPIGWRFMSTIFGSFTLVGMYLLAYVIFESEQIAIWVALLTLFNQLLYVQARIGMLDTFMFCFLVWAMVTYCATWNPIRTRGENRKLLSWTGIFLGLGTACKWFVVVPWTSFLALALVMRVLQNWGTTFKNPKSDDWYRPDLWKNLKWTDWAISLGIVPVVSYLITFIPLYFVHGTNYGFLDLFGMQWRMWEGQLRVVNSHPYMSQWKDWPTLKRPIWYAFERGPGNPPVVRGVILLGNPLIMWSGLIALLVCLQDWITQRKRESFLILFFYSMYFFCWVLIPRKIAFYYYYYPAGMVLGLALAYSFRKLESKKGSPLSLIKWGFLGLSMIVFIYFFPILAALKIPADSFRKWMWFSSWI